MNASAIYSKSGKGVQEASGKTSHLSRSDRAVLSAIDGRTTLAEVAQKVGKSFDPEFQKLIESLDKGGFIREVAPGAASAAAAKPGAARPAAASTKSATAPIDAASDLDFTTALSIPKVKAAPTPKPPQQRDKLSATIPPAPAASSAEDKAKAERIAREQQEAFVKAREEAERKAAAERDRLKAEAEAKMRSETEAKLRAEAEAKAKADAEAKLKAAAEAKVKAAREAAAKAAAKAAAEAKAKAEAEAKRAREEAQEAAEKARREQEELRRQLEAERRAREEAERRAREEAQRLEEERRQLEEEKKRRDEERRREEEERAQRRLQEQRERVARKRQQEEESSLPKIETPPEPARAAAPGAGAFSDSLLADLESFSTTQEREANEREEELRKEKEAAAARAREAEERRVQEEAERQAREEKQRRKQEEAERQAREQAELREQEEREKQRLQEEEEKRKAEAEERARKAREEEQKAAQATRAGASYDSELRAKRERALMGRRPRAGGAARLEKRGWGKPIALGLFVILLIGVGVLHVMPIDTSEFERAASDALGQPVRIAAARLSLVSGLQVKLSDVRVGEGVRISQVRAYPELDALSGPRKAFSRIELDGAKLPQDALGQALFARVKAENFSVGRIGAKNLELIGPLALPKGLEFELIYDREGAVRAATVRGPEALLARLVAKRGEALEIDMTASSFTLPFAPEISLSRFSLKGTASPRGLAVQEWDGALLNGTVSGTASVRWGESWSVDGVVTARNINAAVFAPALLSEGRGEGSGKFSMRGQPGKLASTGRLDGSFTVTRGVLGSIDLSRAIQTGGKHATGRTTFSELNGQGTYDRGAVALRNVTLSAGQLNAGASADIAQNGALSGRIVADVKVASQSLRATLNLGGTVKEPQVKQ